MKSSAWVIGAAIFYSSSVVIVIIKVFNYKPIGYLSNIKTVTTY